MHQLAGVAALTALVSATASLAEEAPAGKPGAGPPTVVQEVVITAERPAAQTLIDRKVYTIANDLQATSGTAAEVLNDVPSVAVDADGNVTLRGDPNVTILTDGKPSAQFAGATRGLSLLQFPASEIERIEVLTSPPAQFKAEGSGGVINIITKRTRREGLSGSGQLSLGDKRRYVFGLSGAYNRDALKLSGAIGLRQDAKRRLTAFDRVTVDPFSNAATASQQRLNEQFLRLIPSASASVDYQLNARQSFGASFSHRELTGNRYFDQHDLSGPPGAPATSVSLRHSDGHEWSTDGAEAAHLEQKLWRPGETLRLSLARSVTRERERYAYRNTSSTPVGGPTFDDLHLSLDLVKTEFSADYDLPLKGDRDLKLGYDLEDDRDAFDNVADITDPITGRPLGSPTVVNHFRYRQRVNAGYAQYQTPFGAWQLQAGLRVETADVSFLQITGDIPGARREAGLYPSLHLDRSLGEDAKLSAGLSRRITRPDPEALNPFADSQDSRNLRAGNPNLAPQDTWMYELGYTGVVGALDYGLTAYYRTDRNSVTDVVRAVAPGVALATKANLPRSRSEGLEFSASGKLWQVLTYRLSGDVFNAQIDTSGLGAAGLKSTTGVNLKGSLDWRPTSVDAAQISVSRSDRRLTPQGFVAAIDIVNLGYRRQLRPAIALVATVSDLFDGQRQIRFVSTPQLTDRFERRQFGRVAMVGLVYTFGAPSKAKPNGFDYDQ